MKALACMLALAAGAAGVQSALRPGPLADAPTAESLYQRARDDLSAEPDALRAQLQARLAALEAATLPLRARIDAQAAFNAALSYTPPMWDSHRGLALAAKQIAERDAVTALALSGSLEEALALIPKADIPHAPLYDTLLSIRMSGGGPSASVRIIRACMQDTGQFPFQGAAHQLARQAREAGERTDLVLQGVESVEKGVQPEQYQFATLFLAESLQALPTANGTIEDAVVALLADIAGDQPGTRQGIDRLSGGQLLNLLAKIDPMRAAEARASYPQFDQHSPSILAMGFLGPMPAQRAHQSLRRANASASALREQAASVSDGPERVSLLLEAAEAELQKGNARAAEADLGNATEVWAPSMPVNLGIRLGSDLLQVGGHDDAVHTFGRICDHAAAVLATNQTHFDSDDGSQQSAILQNIARADGSQAAETFSAVARADFRLAARRALALPPGFGVSMVVAAVAASAPDEGRKTGHSGHRKGPTPGAW